MTPVFDLRTVRECFPALDRRVDGREVAYFDGPAGSQVPQCVADAVADCMLRTNANHGGPFATSRESDERLDQAHHTLADFLGTDDPGAVSFGPNMTTLTFALSRALGRSWQAGDEILVTQLDHDANVTPWVLAARDAGATIRSIAVREADCTLDVDDFRNKLSEKTRLVAVGLASNATGTVNPVKEMARAAHEAGALMFVDAVHYAPHRLIDVVDLDCDFLTCSAYKFFGPHVGIQWGRRELLDSIAAYKLRPAPEELPGRWMTGTQNHEGIVGAAAAVEYLASLAGADDAPRRQRLAESFDAIVEWENQLLKHL
ncbi:MAG: cysteine desulfurase-like protein, partial [Planctomycetaceae bacterium]|nr:cysteine desulfurase-like protein [Planctomycetaceae bacterium]